MGTTSVSQFFLSLHQPQDFSLLSSSNQFFPNWFDLFVGKDYSVRAVMIDYQIDDTQLRLKSRFSPHLKRHNSRNFCGITHARKKDAEKIPESPDTPWYTEQHCRSSQANTRKKTQCYICRRHFTRGIPPGLFSVQYANILSQK